MAQHVFDLAKPSQRSLWGRQKGTLKFLHRGKLCGNPVSSGIAPATGIPGELEAETLAVDRPPIAPNLAFLLNFFHMILC